MQKILYSLLEFTGEYTKKNQLVSPNNPSDVVVTLEMMDHFKDIQIR